MLEGSAAAVEIGGLGLDDEAACAVDQVGATADAPDSGKKAYIRWNVVRRKGTELSMYQDGADLIVDFKQLLASVLTLSGATAPQGKHPRVKWSYGASLDDALDDATNLREQLDK